LELGPFVEGIINALEQAVGYVVQAVDVIESVLPA